MLAFNAGSTSRSGTNRLSQCTKKVNTNDDSGVLKFEFTVNV